MVPFKIDLKWKGCRSNRRRRSFVLRVFKGACTVRCKGCGFGFEKEAADAVAQEIESNGGNAIGVACNVLDKKPFGGKKDR